MIPVRSHCVISVDWEKVSVVYLLRAIQVKESLKISFDWKYDYDFWKTGHSDILEQMVEKMLKDQHEDCSPKSS